MDGDSQQVVKSISHFYTQHPSGRTPLARNGMHEAIGNESAVTPGTGPKVFSYWRKWKYGHAK